MRIDRLYIKEFKNLIDFEIDFHIDSIKQVIVGRNSTGKSNLFEAIAIIFRDLDLSAPTNFEYIIEYLCNENIIKIENEIENKALIKEDDKIKPIFKRKYWIKWNKDISNSLFSNEYEFLKETDFNSKNKSKDSKKRLLPSYVFAYYSGIVTRLKDIFKEHEKKYYKDQIAGEEQPLRPLFLAKPHHSQFALLAFYASQDPKAKDFLENEFGILGIDSVLFSLREPFWNIGKPSKQKIKNGDPRFWYSAGKVKLFLEKLFEYSFAPMAMKDRIEVLLDKFKTKERRYCFIPDEKILKKLASGLAPKEFFARMESMLYTDLIDEDGSDVQININIKNCSKPITFYDLSEGERQLITVLGLMRFTKENEALFLLDEPDTHQNPAWCLDYLRNIKEYGAEPPHSQIIMTTHNPLTFAGLKKEEVVILEKDNDGHIYSFHPSTAPIGMGVEAILTSEYFGMQSALDRNTYEKLQKKRELDAFAFKNEITDQQRNDLEKLTTELEQLGFSKTDGDPLYHKFLNAIANRSEFKKPLLTKKELEEQEKITDSILNSILEKNG